MNTDCPSAILEWSPDVLGEHTITVAVFKDYQFIGEESAPVIINRCPSNLFHYYPVATAMYGRGFTLTTGLAVPRLYESQSLEFVSCVVDAPRFTYQDVEWVVDKPLENAIVDVAFDNDSVVRVVTDQKGLALFSDETGQWEFPGWFWNKWGTNFNLSLGVNSVSNNTLFEGAPINNTISFSDVNVENFAHITNDDDFQFNVTIQWVEGDTAFVLIDHPVDISVSLFKNPVSNVPLEVVEALYLGFEFSEDGADLNYSSRNYVRVTAAGDVNYDCKVNMRDTGAIAKAFGSSPGDPNWNEDADIDENEKINMRDLAWASRNFGKSRNSYITVNGEMVELDRMGFAEVPISGGTIIHEGAWAKVQFFSIFETGTVYTDNVGHAEYSFSPSAAQGMRYLLYAKPQPWNGSLLEFNVSTVFPWQDEVHVNFNYMEIFELEYCEVLASAEIRPLNGTYDLLLVGRALEKVTGEPIQDCKVQLDLWDAHRYGGEKLYADTLYTNSSGMFSVVYHRQDESWRTCYELKAIFSYSPYKTAYVTTYYDRRYSTYFVSSQGDFKNVIAGLECELEFQLNREGDVALSDRPVDFYVDGAYVCSKNTSFPSGNVSLFQVFDEGVHFLTVVYNSSYRNWWEIGYDAGNKKSCNFTLVVNADTTPVNVLFDVFPKTFWKGDDLFLNATLLDASSGGGIGSGYVVDFFEVNSSGVVVESWSNTTNSQGSATCTIPYPDEDEAYAFYAKAPGDAIQNIATNPIELVVAKETELALSVDRDDHLSKHKIQGQLLHNGFGVSSKQIRIKVNETEYLRQTDQFGWFSLEIDLQPENDSQTTYMITASFEGDTVKNASATFMTLDDSEYASCTTIFYGYKPSSNAITVIVIPQATDQIASTKTPEELQQEAEDNDWYRVESEFTLSYPWFRLHLRLNVDFPQGNPNIDYGWSPLPGGESYKANNIVLANILNDISYEIETGILVDFLVSMILQFGIAAIAGSTGIYTAIAIAIYAAFSAAQAMILYLTTEEDPNAWLAAFITSTFSGTCGAALSGLNTIMGVLTSAARLVFGKIQSVMHSLWAKGLNFFSITTAAFALIDFAFMVFYSCMYLTSI